ncbi:MAG: triose-phosphate isomerase [Desulfobacterales bacterium]|jgi:triosephosphate isomerase
MPTRKPLIAGNWKMFKTGPEAETTAARLAELVGDHPAVDIMIAPPFTALALVARMIPSSPIALGAQNLYWEAEGAFTGEISPGMLKAAGCTYVIIGHSERRQYFGESDAGVNRKTKAALQMDLKPVVCIGETESQREAEETFSVLDKQLGLGLEGLSLRGPADLVVAYEPVWAIGTGKTASRDQAQEVHEFLRQKLEKILGPDMARGIRILYGGSVKPDNIASLMAMPDIDGALVGGASLKPEIFAEIIRFSA